jgi:hypothetical protein
MKILIFVVEIFEILKFHENFEIMTVFSLRSDQTNSWCYYGTSWLSFIVFSDKSNVFNKDKTTEHNVKSTDHKDKYTEHNVDITDNNDVSDNRPLR